MVSVARFELATPASPRKCATRLRYTEMPEPRPAGFYPCNWSRTAREVLPVAEKADDQPTLDLLTQRMQVHEKNAWMLRSLLKK